MQIVATKTETWKLPVQKNDDGAISEVLPRVAGIERAATEIDNVVFDGRLRFLKMKRSNTHRTQMVFKDEHSGLLLQFSPKTIEMLLLAVQDGRVKVVKQAYEGKFTFGNYANYVYCQPLDESDEALLGL